MNSFPYTLLHFLSKLIQKLCLARTSLVPRLLVGGAWIYCSRMRVIIPRRTRVQAKVGGKRVIFIT